MSATSSSSAGQQTRREGAAVHRPASTRGGLLWVLAGATVLRLVSILLSLSADGAPTSDLDSKDYVDVSRHVGSLFDADGRLLGITVLRPPGYSVFIWPSRAIAGVPGVLLFQVALSLATVWLTFLLAKRVAGVRGALLAAVVVAVEPLTVLYTGYVLTETMFAFLVLLTLHALLRCLSTNSVFWAALTGVVIAAAAWVRPVGLYLPIIFAAYLVLRYRKRRQAVLAAVLVAAFIVPTGAWVARNAALAGGPLYSSVAGYNLLNYRAAAALAQDEGVSREEAAAQLQARVAAEGGGPGASEYRQAQVERRIGKDVITEHLGATVHTSAVGAAHVLVAPGSGKLERSFPGLAPSGRKAFALASSGLAVGLLVLGLLGLAVGARKQEAVRLLSLTAAYLLVVTFGAEGDSRFRVPVVPLLAVLAACGVNWVTERRQPSRSDQPGAAASMTDDVDRPRAGDPVAPTGPPSTATG